MVLGLLSFQKVSGNEIAESLHIAPPNEAAIAYSLINQGKIPKNASQAEIEKAVNEYLRVKLSPENIEEELYDQEIELNAIEKQIENLNFLHGKKIGKETSLSEEVQPQEYNGSVMEPKLLILLAEFSEDEYGIGPLHNQIERPSDLDNTSIWVDDFGTDHYNKMLFTEGGYDAIDKDGNILHLDSMVDYYLEQSGGSLKVSGQAYGWFKVGRSEAYYGDDENGGHDNKLPGGRKDLVRDVLTAADLAGVPLSDFDFDGDGYIDRLVIVHAGVDQSGGGGAQGDDALWAHSSGLGTKDPWVSKDGSVKANRYIMQGEDGTIGVFCHEFGHNLGLPDEYDTKYSGNGDSVAFYSLMSSGSWTGQPLGAMPAPLSPHAKLLMQARYGGNWATNVTEVNYEDITSEGLKLTLDQATSKGLNNTIIKVNLPVQENGKEHYYLLEWRNFNNTDKALKYGYNFTDSVNSTVEFFEHSPGLLVWYRNTSYTNNWTGTHPGYGFIGLVDSNPEPMVSKGLDIRTRLQVRDASFSFDSSADETFTFDGKSKVYQGKQGVPEFNDAHSYFNPKASSAGLKIPTYGIKIRVTGHSPENTVGEVVIYK